MLNAAESPCGILYIDDEEKALKYFKMSFSSKFPVFTAASGTEGLELLTREADKIGIVISDQRMPEMLGAEVLGIIRERFPRIVRILATAYSDLDSAIQAVNKGHIYQYVVKPWDITELGMVLQRAAAYHTILCERDELLSLKMATLQRIICSDRLKWLLLSCRSWNNTSRSAFRRALVAFVAALPQPLKPVAGSNEKSSARNFELSTLLHSEYHNAVRCLDSTEALKSSPAFSTESTLAKSLTEPLDTFAATAGKDPQWRLVAVSRFKTLFATLVGEYHFDSNQIEPTCHNGASGATIVIVLRPPSASMPTNVLARNLFGLLLMEETPSLSLQLFEALVALAHTNDSLTISIEGAEPSTETLTLRFSLAEDTAETEDAAIECLVEKFASWDISEL